MATSGTYTWSLTAEKIINEALEDLKVIKPGGTPTAAIQTSALQKLNMITKALATKGVRIWTVEWIRRTFSTPSIRTGSDGNDYVCILGHTTAEDSEPITGDNWSSFWYQASATEISTIITAGGMLDDVPLTGYSSLADFYPDPAVLNILAAFVRHSTVDYPLTIGSIGDYFSIESKWRWGRPTDLFFEKRTTPRVYLWPQPDIAAYDEYVLHYLAEMMLEDFATVNDDPDMQSIYMDYLVKALVLAMAPKFNKSLQEQSVMAKKEDQAFRLLKKSEVPVNTGRSIAPSYPVNRRYRRS